MCRSSCWLWLWTKESVKASLVSGMYSNIGYCAIKLVCHAVKTANLKMVDCSHGSAKDCQGLHRMSIRRWHMKVKARSSKPCIRIHWVGWWWQGDHDKNGTKYHGSYKFIAYVLTIFPRILSLQKDMPRICDELIATMVCCVHRSTQPDLVISASCVSLFLFLAAGWNNLHFSGHCVSLECDFWYT
jgi:hypothetical protein